MSVATWAWIILGIVVVLFAVIFGARQIPHARRYFRIKAM